MNIGTHLILVRHSSPEIVKNAPARKWNLSDKGIARARKLAEKLTYYRPEVVFSSDEPKAQQTAEIIGKAFGLVNHVAEDLHEQERSQIPFLTSNEEFQNKVRNAFEQPDELVFGSETANQALARFRTSVNSVLASSDAKTILITAHGTVISLFTSWLTGSNGYSIWQELGLPSFVVLDMQSRKIMKIENVK